MRALYSRAVRKLLARWPALSLTDERGGTMKGGAVVNTGPSEEVRVVDDERAELFRLEDWLRDRAEVSKRLAHPHEEHGYRIGARTLWHAVAALLISPRGLFTASRSEITSMIEEARDEALAQSEEQINDLVYRRLYVGIAALCEDLLSHLRQRAAA
jgi:hypothetical protein